MMPAVVRDFQAFMASYVPIAGAETAEAASAEGTEGENAAEAPQVDLSPLTERMDDVIGRIGSLEERLPAEQQQGTQTGAAEDEFGYGQPGAELGQQYDPNQQYGQGQFGNGVDPTDPEAALQLVREEAQRAAQSVLQPELQRQHQQRIEAEGEQLLDDYPELEAREAQQTLSTDAQQWAQDIAGSILGSNPQLAQAVAGAPAFLELVHLAAKTAERAGQETPAGQVQAEVGLESGSATNQGGGEAQANLGERIAAAGQSDPFWIGSRRS